MKLLKLTILSLILLVSVLTTKAQSVLFSDDFSKPGKWSFWSSEKGTKEYAKDGDESYLSIQSKDGNEFCASIKVPKPSSAAKGFRIVYIFKSDELKSNPVAFGTTPNRLRLTTETNGKLRLSGENISISNGAQFFSAYTLGEWHKMEITYDIATKTSIFRLDDNALRTVELNKQTESQTFVPDRINLSSITDGGKAMYKLITIEEIQ